MKGTNLQLEVKILMKYSIFVNVDEFQKFKNWYWEKINKKKENGRNVEQRKPRGHVPL